jgi:hypothetical protein
MALKRPTAIVAETRKDVGIVGSSRSMADPCAR